MNQHHNCSSCNSKGARLRCASCKRAYYCNKKCQRADWKSGHKQKCTQKYLESSKLYHAQRSELSKNTQPAEFSNACLPSKLFNKNKFVTFCNNVNKIIAKDISSLIYCYLTSHQTTFKINNKELELYHFDYFRTLLRYRIRHIEHYEHWLSFKKCLNASRRSRYEWTEYNFQSLDWIKMKEFNIAILRDSTDDILGDSIDVNIQICPPDGISNSHTIGQFRAIDIMQNLTGSEIGKLIKCLLNYHNIPYQKFKLIQLSHAAINDKQIRCDLLNTLQNEINDKIQPAYDYWSGETGMKYETEFQYNIAKIMGLE
eukprot:272056_1